MAKKFTDTVSKEFEKAVEESLSSLREGARITGTVISATDKGISVNIGRKKDGFIAAADAGTVEYNPADYSQGAEIEAQVVSTKADESGCILLSKKKVDDAKEGDKVIETIRNGEIFEIKVDKETNGGLLGKLGNYTVFIPASQVAENFVRDLKKFIGKPMRLQVLEVDDKKRRIVATAKKLIIEERKAREEIFWNAMEPDVIVSGTVKRTTNFGAFVAVDGFDCLAHVADLSWNHVKSPDDVVKVGKTYDFLVLSVDRERGRVSLSYKALQPHPFDVCIEKYPVGSKIKGKVTSLVSFGAFIEVAPNIEGLCHVSEVSQNFVKSPSEVLKIGDEVEALVTSIDLNNKKINLSIKACLPEAEKTATDEENSDTEKDAKPARAKKSAAAGDKKPRAPKEPKGETSFVDEDVHNNPLANLLKDIDVDAKGEKK